MTQHSKGYSLTVEPRSSKPLVWVRFLLSLNIFNHSIEPLSLKSSSNHILFRTPFKKRLTGNLSKTDSKTFAQSLKTRRLGRRVLFTKVSPRSQKLRRYHYRGSQSGINTGTFFKFVRTSPNQTSSVITYPKFLVSQLKTFPNNLTEFRSHVSVLRNKFFLYEIYRDSVLLQAGSPLPNFKLCIQNSSTYTVSAYSSLTTSVNTLPHDHPNDYMNNIFTGLNSYLYSLIYPLDLGAHKRLRVNPLSAARLFYALKKELSFKSTIKWLNIRRRKDFKRYYTFYSHYESTVRDQRSYRRVMLPKFKDSKRGSLWFLPGEYMTTETTFNIATKKPLSNSWRSNLNKPATTKLMSNYPRTSLITSVRKSRLNVIKSKSFKLRSNPRRLVRFRVKRFRRFRRSLRWFFKRFYGLHGYLRRSSKRRKRKLKRFIYRFIKLRKRRTRSSAFRLSRSFFRRRYFRVLRRRIKKLLRRRFKLPATLQKRFKRHRLSNTILGLRRTIRSIRRIRILLSRPSFIKLKSTLAKLSYDTTSGRSSYSSNPVTARVTQPRVTKDSIFCGNGIAGAFLFNNDVNLIGLSPFKYLLTDQSSFKRTNYYSLKNLIIQVQQQVYSYANSFTPCRLDKSNLWFINQTGYSIRRKFLRLIASSSFSADLSFWYYKTLIQFIENCSGRRTNLYFGPFIENSLTFEDRARCTLWNNRVTGFQRIMGHRIFVYEALSIVAISIRIKDPTFLANWIRGMLKRLSFWRYRLIFRYLKFLLRYIFQPNFHLFDFRGVKLSLKGKISVAGNARTRTLFMRFGDTSHSKMDNKVAYDLSLVNTFTGVLGFKLLFYY